ncbi:hypothetical protein D3C74_281500 [compost metagenome]
MKRILNQNLIIAGRIHDFRVGDIGLPFIDMDVPIDFISILSTGFRHVFSTVRHSHFGCPFRVWIFSIHKLSVIVNLFIHKLSFQCRLESDPVRRVDGLVKLDAQFIVVSSGR